MITIMIIKKIFNILINYLFNILKYLILFLILINILNFINDIYLHVHTNDLFSNFVPRYSLCEAGDKIDSIPIDPVRWWPSGVPHWWSIVGTGIATFGVLSKIPNVSPRLRVLGALGSACVTASQVTYHSAIENPVGFNRLMWGLSEYRRTGSWPCIDQKVNNVSDKQVIEFANEVIKQADKSKVESIVNEVCGKKNFLPSSNFDISDLINNLIDTIFKETMQLLKPVHVQGFFDDLIGQRMFVETILFILCISIVLLFIVFIFNLIFLLNKDKIINKFNNKIISFYVKYHAFLSKITLFYIPIFIFIGLFTLCHGLHWLITNQIPYESLDVDLHKFISTRSFAGSYILCLNLSSNKINISNFNNYFINLKKRSYSRCSHSLALRFAEGQISRSKGSEWIKYRK